MGNGTFQAKYIPLSMVDNVESILVIRKSTGPSISRVKYYELPRLCKNVLFNHLITPFILLRKARNKKTDLILSYHFVPHAYFAYIASLLSGKDFIFAQTGGDIQEKFRNPFWRFVIKRVCKRAKYILVPGKQARDFWIKNLPVKNKIHILIDFLLEMRILAHVFECVEQELIAIRVVRVGHLGFASPL